MGYYKDDLESRKVINYPSFGSSEHKHKKERIYATQRGLEKKCGGNGNPNADPEILVCQGGLESLWGAAEIQSFEFVTGIIQGYSYWDANSEPIFGGQILTKGPDYNIGDWRGCIVICTVHFSEPVFVTGNPRLEVLLTEPGATENPTLLGDGLASPPSANPYLAPPTANSGILRAKFESMETREADDSSYWNSIQVADANNSKYSEGEVITPVTQKYLADQYLYPNGSSSITFTLVPTETGLFGLFGWKPGSLFSIGVNAIDLNGGTIKDVGGVNADITNSSSRGSSAGHATVFHKSGSIWVEF
jgi:hypothetical protein